MHRTIVDTDPAQAREVLAARHGEGPWSEDMCDQTMQSLSALLVYSDPAGDVHVNVGVARLMAEWAGAQRERLIASAVDGDAAAEDPMEMAETAFAVTRLAQAVRLLAREA